LLTASLAHVSRSSPEVIPAGNPLTDSKVDLLTTTEEELIGGSEQAATMK
jgi:hypothetical protein